MKNVLYLLLLVGTQAIAQQTQCPITASSYKDCRTGLIQLSATPGFTFYSWSPAANLSNATIANPTTTVAGTYTVTGTTGIGANLLANPDFSGGNTGFSSGHTYTTWYNPCNYFVGPIWFGSYFPTLTDHTPTTDNFFMHIDGCNPATMIWEQTVPVTSFTNYIFDFWASRSGVAQPIFEIEFIGDVTGSTIINTLNGIPDNGNWTWDNYGTGCWNAGANRTVTLRIKNLQTAGYGNDFGLDDMSFKVCCSSTAIVTTSSLGQELVTNGDFSAGNTGFTSGQNYSTSYAPCNYYVGAQWFVSFFPGLLDNTPTADNMFMHVDGCAPATVVWQQTINISNNTVYKFEFYASRSGVAQPKFRIEYIGNMTGLTTFPTQNGSVPLSAGVLEWERFGIGCWNSQNNSTVTIRVTNMETASYGNDFGMDDFSFRQCCDTRACCRSIQSQRLADENESENAGLSVELYPNPASAFVLLQLPEGFVATQVQVLDATGRIVLDETASSNQVRIATEQLTEGIYFVRVFHAGGSLKPVPLTIQK